MGKTYKDKAKITPGRVAERRLTEDVAEGRYTTRLLPDKRVAVVDMTAPKGKRIKGYLGKNR